MAAQAQAQNSWQSLTQTFNKLNHKRHHIMDASMLLGAISMAVMAAGPLVGIIDPITPFLKMHVDGFLSIGSLFDFIPDAIDNLDEGIWSSGIEVAGHGMDHGGGMMGMDHMAGGMGHAAHVGLEDQLSQFNEWTKGISPDEMAAIKEEANLVYGETLFDYFQHNFLGH